MYLISGVCLDTKTTLHPSYSTFCTVDKETVKCQLSLKLGKQLFANLYNYVASWS